jgi:hypothetical protein
MEPTDQELLAATAARDGEAFAIFWRRHTSTVMAFGIHHCATSEDVADLVADTFLAAFRAAGRYPAPDGHGRPVAIGDRHAARVEPAPDAGPLATRKPARCRGASAIHR